MPARLKGVGRGCQQAPAPTPVPGGWPTPGSPPPERPFPGMKTCPARRWITAADLLIDRVLPFAMKNTDLPVLRILTDRGTGCCGRVGKHDCQLFLAINDIPSHGLQANHCRGSGPPQNQGEATSDQRYPRTRPQDGSLGDFTRSRSARRSAKRWKPCRPIWMTGCSTTTLSAHIRAKCVAAEHPSKL